MVDRMLRMVTTTHISNNNNTSTLPQPTRQTHTHTTHVRLTRMPTQIHTRLRHTAHAHPIHMLKPVRRTHMLNNSNRISTSILKHPISMISETRQATRMAATMTDLALLGWQLLRHTRPTTMLALALPTMRLSKLLSHRD